MSATVPRRRSTTMKFTWGSAPSPRQRLPPPRPRVAPHVLVLRLARGHGAEPLLQVCVLSRLVRALPCVLDPRSVGHPLLEKGPRRGHRRATPQRARSHPGARFGLRSRMALRRVLCRRATSGNTLLNGAVLLRERDHHRPAEIRRWFFPWLRRRNFLADTIGRESASLAPSATTSTLTPRPPQRAAARDSALNQAPPPPRFKPLLLLRPWLSHSQTLPHRLPGTGLARLPSTCQCLL